MQITHDMPPVFLVATQDDPVVNYKNSIVLETALKTATVPHKFLLYETGGHGFGMDEKRGGEAATWKNHFAEWLKEVLFER